MTEAEAVVTATRMDPDLIGLSARGGGAAEWLERRLCRPEASAEKVAPISITHAVGDSKSSKSCAYLSMSDLVAVVSGEKFKELSIVCIFANLEIY